MKRCTNCNIQFSDAEMICDQCATELEPIPDRRGANGSDSGLAMQKKDKLSGAETNPSAVNPLLEAAQACFLAGEFSDCIQQLENAMGLGATEAKRLFGCFLDDSEDFRLAVERYYYSERFSSAFISPSMQTERISTKTAEPSKMASSGTAASASISAGASGSAFDGIEELFQAGKAELKRGLYDSAFQSFRKAAEADHAMAQYYLGECYSNGKGVPRDAEKADKWYRQAIMRFESPGRGQKDAEVLFCLGECYENGKGVERNSEKAVKFYILAAGQYRKAAEQGNAAAMYRLGWFNEYGICGKVNGTEAVKWYLKAINQYSFLAEMGDVEAQFTLGRCYEEGKGVDENKAEAAKWYRLAARQGHDGAQLKLAEFLYCGCGVKKNKAEAIKWYRKAEALGNNFAGKKLSGIARKKRLVTTFRILLLLLLIAGSIWGIWALRLKLLGGK